MKKLIDVSKKINRISMRTEMSYAITGSSGLLLLALPVQMGQFTPPAHVTYEIQLKIRT